MPCKDPLHPSHILLLHCKPTNRPQALAVRHPGHSSDRTPKRWLRLHTVGLRLLYVEFPKARLHVADPASAIELPRGPLHSRLKPFLDCFLNRYPGTRYWGQPQLPLRNNQSRSRLRCSRQLVRAANLRREAQTRNAQGKVHAIGPQSPGIAGLPLDC